MCGINGIMTKKITTKHLHLVEKMNQVLHNRGPDASAILVNRNLVLGHTLLSIINRHSNKQPISRNKITVALNGEIYNYSLLKKYYEKKTDFLTNSDAEILIYLYLEHGENFINQLEGEFAFTLFDAQHNKLLLAVDHLGIKPLYYGSDGANFVFSSQINALLESGLIKKEFNGSSLQDCFTLGACAGSATLFKDIKKLTGGSYLIVDQSLNVTTKKYHHIADYLQTKNSANLETILQDATNLRSQSDTKIGISLSGGVDSSLIGYYLKKKRDDAYSVSIDTSAYLQETNEDKYRQLAVEKIQTRQVTVSPLITNRSSVMREILALMDDFAYLPMIFANYFIYRQAKKKKIRVLLSGDGSDELFLGYDFFPLLQRIISAPNKLNAFRSYLKLTKNIRIAYNSYTHYLLHDNFYFSHHFYFNETEKLYLFKKNNYPHIEDKTTSFFDKYQQLEILNQFLIGEIKFRFRQPLTIIDRMASGQQVENRLPYLSKEMINYAINLPVNQKIKNGIGKYPVKKTAEKYFPKQFIYRPKIGLGFSIDFLIKNKRKLLNQILINNTLIKEGFFRKNYLNYLFTNLLKRKKLLFTDELLLFFFLWFNFYFEDKSLLNYLD